MWLNGIKEKFKSRLHWPAASLKLWQAPRVLCMGARMPRYRSLRIWAKALACYWSRQLVALVPVSFVMDCPFFPVLSAILVSSSSISDKNSTDRCFQSSITYERTDRASITGDFRRHRSRSDQGRFSGRASFSRVQTTVSMSPLAFPQLSTSRLFRWNRKGFLLQYFASALSGCWCSGFTTSWD